MGGGEGGSKGKSKIKKVVGSGVFFAKMSFSLRRESQLASTIEYIGIKEVLEPSNSPWGSPLQMLKKRAMTKNRFSLCIIIRHSECTATSGSRVKTFPGKIKKYPQPCVTLGQC